MDPATVFCPDLECPARGRNRPGHYWHPFAEGEAVHLPAVPQDLHRHKRHRLLPAAHRGGNRGEVRLR